MTDVYVEGVDSAGKRLSIVAATECLSLRVFER